MDNDMIFKITDLHVQNILITCLNIDISGIKAKVNGKFEFMGFVSTPELHEAMKKILKNLKEAHDD
jgi:hypothetical protein